MPVRFGGSVILDNGVEHRLRLLGRGGVVEIDQGVSVLPLGEQREVGAEAGAVEHQAPPSRSRTRRRSRSRTSGCRIRSRNPAPTPYVRMLRAASGASPRLRGWESCFGALGPAAAQW